MESGSDRAGFDGAPSASDFLDCVSAGIAAPSHGRDRRPTARASSRARRARGVRDDAAMTLDALDASRPSATPYSRKSSIAERRRAEARPDRHAARDRRCRPRTSRADPRRSRESTPQAPAALFRRSATGRPSTHREPVRRCPPQTRPFESSKRTLTSFDGRPSSVAYVASRHARRCSRRLACRTRSSRRRSRESTPRCSTADRGRVVGREAAVLEAARTAAQRARPHAAVARAMHGRRRCPARVRRRCVNCSA